MKTFITIFIAISPVGQALDRDRDVAEGKELSRTWTHHAFVVDTLERYDGDVIVEDEGWSKSMVAIWNAAQENVDVYVDGDLMPAVYGVDEEGRPTFQVRLETGAMLTGSVDVSVEDVLMVIVTMEGEPVRRYLSSHSLSDGDFHGAMAAVAQACSCNATGEIGGCNLDTDCTNGSPCTLKSGVQSTCKWGETLRDPAPCGRVATESMLVAFPAFLFAKLVSRRRWRR